MIAEKVSAAVMYSGAAISAGSGGSLVFGLMTKDEWSVLGIVAGILLGFTGWGVNWLYKHLHYRLAQKHAKAISDEG